MIRYGLLLLCMLVALITGVSKVEAQMRVEKSDPIDKMCAGGFTRILQLKNGGTFVVHYASQRKMGVVVFDKQRKKIAETTVEIDEVTPNGFIAGMFELNNELVVFLKEIKKMQPVLYRLRLNLQTGALIAEETVYEFPRPRMSEYKGMGSDDITVAKDPLSDCYAVVIYRGSGNRDEYRIRAIHFDGNHKQLSSAIVPFPNDEVKTFYPMNAVVNGDKSVFVVAYSSESLLGHKNGKVYVARINNGESVSVIKPLDFTHDFRRTSAKLLYDQQRNLLLMLSNTETKGGEAIAIGNDIKTYSSFVTVIDPATLNVRWVHELGTRRVSEAKKSTPGSEGEFTGIPQNMILNGEGTAIIVMEELVKREASPFGSSGNYMTMGDIGIMILENDSVEKTGYYMKRKQYSLGSPNMNVLGMHGADLVMTVKGMYLLFNEIPENIKRKEEGKRLQTAYRRDQQLVCYLATSGKMELQKLFVKGAETEDEFEDVILYAHYDESTHTYATVTRAEEGSEDAVRVRWITFE